MGWVFFCLQEIYEWSKWVCNFHNLTNKKGLYSVTPISHTQAAAIPSPTKETTCPLFPPEDRIPKLERL